MSYEVVNSELKYKGRIIDVVQDEITLPNGKTALREVVVRGCAAAIIPIDKDGNITFVRQYRHGTRQMILEIPAGMIDEGEDPEMCAIRELEEETGLVAGKIHKLLDLQVSVGFCTEIIYIYIADELTEGKQNFDPDEFLDLETYTLGEAIKKIMTGDIADSKTIAGIFAANEYFQTIGTDDFSLRKR